MKIKVFVLGNMQTNSYLAINEETKECFLVDPACYSRRVTEYIKEQDLKLRAILLTHGHFDHIMGIDGYVKEYQAPVYAHKEEQLILEHVSYNLSEMCGEPYAYFDAEYLTDGQEIEAAGFQIRVIHTPGHTIGGCCYYIPAAQALFSGDTLFCGTVGRTDFPTGSMGKLVRSVREKLFVLPDDTAVYPGHMESTTIAYEKSYNEVV